jgi:hypothetical protein
MPEREGFSRLDVATPRTRWGTTIVAVKGNMRSMAVEQQESEHTTDLAFDDRPFKVRVAKKDNHRGAASFLISKMYSWRGYKSAPLREHPNRLTLVASEPNRHIGTISIGFDSPIGLLVDDLYKDEVDLLRNRGAKLCETIRLAVDRGARSKRVLGALFHIVVVYAYRVRRATDMVIEVNPRHVKFYEEMFDFTQLGPERLNPRVNAPAVLLGVSLKEFHGEIRAFGGRHPQTKTAKSLYPYFFPPAEEEYMVRRLACSTTTTPSHAISAG